MNEDLIGLIPAAGKGVRLGLPYPKELYPVIRNNHYKPISQFVLNNLTQAGLRHIVFVVNETKHQLMGFFGNGHRFGCNISYVVQESATNGQSASTSPGLAHALNSAYHLTQGKTVFFGMADTIMPDRVFAQCFEIATAEDDVILGLFPTERPEKFGMVHFDQNDRVIEIIDKPRQTALTEMWGCIIWRARFSEHLRNCVAQNISDFAEIMNRAIREGMCFRAVHIDSTYIDLGTYDEIMEMDRRFREK